MQFFKLFLRSLVLLPSVVQGVEVLYGAKAGRKKRAAALEILGAAIHVRDAVSACEIVDGERFLAGLGTVVDGVVACLNASLWAKE